MKLEKRFWSKVCFTKTGCWLWKGHIGTNGYGRFAIGGKVKNAHNVAFRLANGIIPDQCFVLHRCDVKACVRPKHLYAGTRAENTKDTIERGQYHRWYGELSPVAKINNRAVCELRNQYNNGIKSYRFLAEKYGISKSQVWNIVTNKMRTDCL